jgi:NADH dehydrogenase
VIRERTTLSLIPGERERRSLIEGGSGNSGGTPDRQGRIPVEPDLTVAGHPELRVVGDVMSLDDLPGVAEVPMQSGWHAGENVRRVLAGQPARPYDREYIRPESGSAAG